MDGQVLQRKPEVNRMQSDHGSGVAAKHAASACPKVLEPLIYQVSWKRARLWGTVACWANINKELNKANAAMRVQQRSADPAALFGLFQSATSPRSVCSIAVMCEVQNTLRVTAVFTPVAFLPSLEVVQCDSGREQTEARI